MLAPYRSIFFISLTLNYILDQSLKLELLVNAVVPGLYSLFKTMDKVLHNIRASEEDILLYQIENKPVVIDSSATSTAPIKSNFPELHNNSKESNALLNLTSMLECVTLLFCGEVVQEVSSNQTSFSYIEDLGDDIVRTIMNCLSIPHLVFLDDEVDLSIDLKKTRQHAAIYGMRFFHSIVKVKILHNKFMEKSICDALEKLLFNHGDQVTKEVIISFTIMLQEGYPKSVFQKSLFQKILKAAFILKTYDEIWPYISRLTRYLFNYTNSLSTINYLSILKREESHAIDIFEDELTVSNRLWTFESAFCNRSVQFHGKYAYEFHLGTSGVIQIGWASDCMNYNEFGGWGMVFYKYL